MEDKAPVTRRYIVRFPEDSTLLPQLRDLARANYRSINAQILKLLTEGLTRENAYQGPRKERTR